jgi:hypothetical protein
MSTSSACSSGKKKAQKYKNKVAFVPNSYSTKYQETINFLVKGVCQRYNRVIKVHGANRLEETFKQIQAANSTENMYWLLQTDYC